MLPCALKMLINASSLKDTVEVLTSGMLTAGASTTLACDLAAGQ